MVHDHFDGSSNCVECKGKCELKGDSLNLTRVIRFLFVHVALRNQGMTMMLSDTIRECGVDAEKFLSRARKAAER